MILNVKAVRDRKLGVPYDDMPNYFGIYVNFIALEPIEEGNHVAFDRGLDGCNKIKVADWGRLGGITLTKADVGDVVIVQPRGVIDFAPEGWMKYFTLGR